MSFHSFVHPSLRIEVFSGKGRGYKAIDRLDVGTLLLEEEAVSVSLGSVSKLTKRLLKYPQILKELYCPPNHPQLKSELEAYNDEEWSRAMAQATCNAFSNNKYYVLGHKASFFNHSCAPNATLWMSENFILRFYAIEPIEAGEEVCIAYGRLYCPREHRQKWLKEEFGFLCQCKRCVDPSQYNDELMTKMLDLPREKQQREEAIRFMNENFDALQLTTEWNNSTTNLESSSQLHPNSTSHSLVIQQLEEFLLHPFGSKYPNSKLHLANWRLLFVRAELISRCLISEEFEKVLFYTLQQMVAESLIYPRYHPLKLPMYHTFLKHKHKIEQHQLEELFQRVGDMIDWTTYETIDNIFCSNKHS